MQRLEAIILAGGSGSRFGGGKLLAPYRGGALIDGAVHAALCAPVAKVVLVTGHEAEAVGERVRAVAARERGDRVLSVVHAQDHREGMAATLRAGVSALLPATNGVLVFLGDMPAIPPSIAATLVAHIGERAAAAPVFKGRRGHPVLFAARLFPALQALSGDKGAREVLDKLGDDLILAPTDDPGVVFDVDRWADLTS